MLVIRRSQMAACEEVAQRVFEQEMLAHLADFSPTLVKAVGDQQMRKAITFGTDRARGYGLTLRGPVRLYLELMLLFGSYFDTDPQYPWVTAILMDRNSFPEMHRAQQLYDKTMEYRIRVAGPDDAYTIGALDNISLVARYPLNLSGADFVAAMRDQIERIYPQKATYIGDAGLDALIHKGIAGAREQGFSTDRSVALLIVLMLAFGHGCGIDPLYPWIGATLRDERVTDPEARARRLERKALTWLAAVLMHFDQEPR